DRAVQLLPDAGATRGVEQVEGDAGRGGGGVELDRDGHQPERDRGRTDRMRRHDPILRVLILSRSLKVYGKRGTCRGRARGSRNSAASVDREMACGTPGTRPRRFPSGAVPGPRASLARGASLVWRREKKTCYGCLYANIGWSAGVKQNVPVPTRGERLPCQGYGATPQGLPHGARHLHRLRVPPEGRRRRGSGALLSQDGRSE